MGYSFYIYEDDTESSENIEWYWGGPDNISYPNNYTYNISSMVSLAAENVNLGKGYSLNKLNGEGMDHVVDTCTSILVELIRHPNVYKMLNPKNEWGTYEGLVQLLTGIVVNCRIATGNLMFDETKLTFVVE